MIHVDKMSKGDTLLLLVGSEKLSTPSEFAVKIVEELGCMSLAIDIVHAYINHTETTLKSYLKMNKKKNDILLKNIKEMNIGQYQNTIASIWDLSFEKICS